MTKLIGNVVDVSHDQHRETAEARTTVEFITAESLSEEQKLDAAAAYSAYRNENDQAIRIGIFGEDIERALNDPGTILLSHESEGGERVAVPLLAPLEILEWYNSDLIKRKYGEDVKALGYLHPPVSEDEAAAVEELIRQKVDEGYVVVTDKYMDDLSSPISRAIIAANSDGDYDVDAFGGDVESRVDVFAGTMNVKERPVSEQKEIHDVYEDMLRNGELDALYGEGVTPSLERVITGDEANRIWDLYEEPFEKLGVDDPTHAGFDREMLLGILADENVCKVVNRVNGELTTLMIFAQNLESTPWFNSSCYQAAYPSFFEGKQIFTFPSIVTDENLQGKLYAKNVIDLFTRLVAGSGRNALITFECTEISTTYIPKLVKRYVDATGVAIMDGIETPRSVIEYFAISRQTKR